MRKISPRRRLPQSLWLLLFIGVSSATDAAANYTLDGSYHQAQSFSTSISSPWQSTRVQNIKGAVPAKTKSTGDATSRLLVLFTHGYYDVTADDLKEIAKKSGIGDFRQFGDFKAEAFRASNYSVVTEFKAGEESYILKPPSKRNDFRYASDRRKVKRTKALFETDKLIRRKRNDWHYTDFLTYQLQNYLYGFGMPMVLIPWPVILMQNPHSHSESRPSKPNENIDLNDNDVIKSTRTGFRQSIIENSKNFHDGARFDDKNEDQDDYNEHVHVDEHDYEEADVSKDSQLIKTGGFSGVGKTKSGFLNESDDEDEDQDDYDGHNRADENDYEEADLSKDTGSPLLKTGGFSGLGKTKPVFPNKRPDYNVPLKKPTPLAHWLEHVYPSWRKNKTVSKN